jgi:MFS family permease
VGRRRAAILALLSTTQLLGVLDFSIVNVALPSIQKEFHLAPEHLQWVVSAYGLTLGGFLLLGGRIADLYPRKQVFIGGLVIFLAASLAGGLAPAAPLVFVARAIQGLGGAVLAPTALALVTSEFQEGRERTRALSVFGTLAAVGFTAGVILGGILTGVAGWRWVFFVNVPIGVAAVVAAVWLLEPPRQTVKHHALDLVGAVLVTAGMVALVWGLSVIAVPTLVRISEAIALLFFAAVLLVSFLAVERSASNPLLPLKVFRLPVVGSANLVAGLTIIVASVLAFTLTLVVQHVLGYSPQITGLVFLPAGLGGIVGGMLGGQAVRRIGVRWSAVSGCLILAFGVAIVLVLGLRGSIGWIAAGYGVAAVGIVGTVVATTIGATSGVGREWQGLAAGLLNTSQQVGGAIGAALAGVIVAGGQMVSYRYSLVVALVILGVAAVVSGLGLGASQRRQEARSTKVA